MWSRLDLFSPLLELILPEYCSGCGAVRGTVPWVTQGARLHGLRPWDGPHLCEDCYAPLCEKTPVKSMLFQGEHSSIPVVAAQWTNSHLVELVGQWKYFSIRGLVWPLGDLLAKAVLQNGIGGPDIVWVPMPLHGRRRRERGFNQARMLAALLANSCGGTVGHHIVKRQRSTKQQAKLVSTQDRQDNMNDAFRLEGAVNSSIGARARIVVVDDIVTTGATAGALVDFLASKSMSVEAVACLGVAKQDSSDC